MAQDYLRQSQPRRGTGGSTLAHRTSNLSDTEAQCLGLLNRSDPALSSTEARTIPAQTLDLIPISNTSIGNSRFSRCRSRTHVNDCDQRVAWVPTVPAARIAEGTSGMETDLSHPQFAQAVPLRPSLADVVRKQEEKPRIGCKKGCCGLRRQQMEVSPVLTSDLVAALSISNGKVKRL